jgi:putative CRISPR-associated protein (TIGR02619 family)
MRKEATMKARASQVACTVGTSLFHSNLVRLPKPDEYEQWLNDQPPSDREHLSCKLVSQLKVAYAEQNWTRLGKLMRLLPPETRLLGAEINSVHELIQRGHIEPKARLFFLHSDTEDGRRVSQVLLAYYDGNAEGIQVDGLDDQDPERFRTQGLRSLAKELGKIIRDQAAANCAINATGGYKAQIAIAVVVGQVTGVPVYYKHERFSAIISLPPLPVSFDLSEWFRSSPLLFALADEDHPTSQFDADLLTPKAESLVDRVDLDGEEYLTLSPLGQVFHDTFRGRYEGEKGRFLPRAASNKEKRQPRIENSGHLRSHPEVKRFMQRVTDEVPQVIQCSTHYFNPALTRQTLFRLSSKGIEGVFSQGGYTVKFRVETTATQDVQRKAMVAELNDWLTKRGR